MNNNDKLARLAINKSLLKEYSNSSNERIVYMNDNTEFQIQFFNPYDYVIGISISFNGSSASNSLLVLKPGERVWLERYLNDKKKFLFSTYEVGNSKSVQKAIENNGEIILRFYKEKEQHSPLVYSSYSINNINWNPQPANLDYTSICGSIDCSLDSNVSCASSAYYCGDINTTTNDIASYTSTATCACTSYNDSQTTKARSKSIETGRIEKGNYSSQDFTHVNYDFEYWAFKTETIKILPTSQKQINSNDLQKDIVIIVEEN